MNYMAKVAIVTDGVNDLSGDMIKNYGILSVPMQIIVGDEVHKIWHNDKCTIGLNEFSNILMNSAKDDLPKTSLQTYSMRPISHTEPESSRSISSP